MAGTIQELGRVVDKPRDAADLVPALDPAVVRTVSDCAALQNTGDRADRGSAHNNRICQVHSLDQARRDCAEQSQTVAVLDLRHDEVRDRVVTAVKGADKHAAVVPDRCPIPSRKINVRDDGERFGGETDALVDEYGETGQLLGVAEGKG